MTFVNLRLLRFPSDNHKLRFLFSLNVCYVGSTVHISFERRTVTDGNQSLKLLTGFECTSLGSFRDGNISII